MASLTQQTRELLTQYLSGQVRPADFGERFAMLTLKTQQTRDVDAQQLCRDVEWEFLDHKRALLTVEQLRQHLAELSEEPANVVEWVPQHFGQKTEDMFQSGTSSRSQSVASGFATWMNVVQVQRSPEEAKKRGRNARFRRSAPRA